MENKRAKVIFIDDRLPENDPFIVECKKKYDTNLINNSTEAVSYIQKNLDNKLIIILDIKFPLGQPDGHQILNEIRKISKLIPVILFTAQEKDEEDRFDDFINNHSFAYISKTEDTEILINKVDEANILIDSQVASALEEWIEIHSEEMRSKPYLLTKDGKSYTLNEILHEIRNRSEFGIYFEKGIHKLAIELLAKNIKNLDENK